MTAAAAGSVLHAAEGDATRFSIVSVVLNDLEGLKRTYASVRKQRFTRYEWLVLDGGSEDGTQPWLQSLGWPQLRWWSEVDDGLYDAMNRGINRARGEYLVFLNAGDELADEDVLATVNREASACDAPDLVYGDALDVDIDGTTYYRKARSHTTLQLTMFACHQAMFFRRQRIGEIRYRMWYRNAADYAFTAEFLESGRGGGDGVRVRRLRRALCRFWLGGISAQRRTVTIAEDYLVRARHMQTPTWMNVSLFMMHQMHTWIKRLLPSFARRLRGKRAVTDGSGNERYKS